MFMLLLLGFPSTVLPNCMPAKFMITEMQVVAGEYELKETNVNWSPEDFESKLQVTTHLFKFHVNGVGYL